MIFRLQVANHSLDFLVGIVFLNVELSQVRFNHINRLLANASGLKKQLLKRIYFPEVFQI